MRLVIALGGNALLRRGEPMTDAAQVANIRQAAALLAPVLAAHEVVITHGNGPQVGLLALQSAALAAGEGVGRASNLDVLDAQSEGMIGYLIERELRNAGPTSEIATLLTQVVVDAADPAFGHPTKPIGPWYSNAEASALEKSRGWEFIQKDGQFRRVVASPAPAEIVGMAAIRLLLGHGVCAICVGGGGIPVVRTAQGYDGVEAVIDKDRSSALLARRIGADRLILLTDVAGVIDGYGSDHAKIIRDTTPTELRAMKLEAGSMGPKVEAACAFATATGNPATIGALTDIAAILAGDAGTLITV